MRKCAVIHWQCLPQARVVTWVPDTFYPCRAGTVSVTKWSVILFEDLPGFGRRHLPLWFSHTLLFVLFPFLEAPAPIPKKQKVTTTLCTKFLLFSLSLILFHEWVISPHPPAIRAEITVFHSTSTFHLPETCFLSDSEAFGRWGRALQPSLWQRFLAEMHFLLHIKVLWKHRNLNPSGVIYIQKYIYPLLQHWSLSRVTPLQGHEQHIV